MNSFDSDDDSSGAEDFKVSEFGLNEWEKSERVIPLAMRRRKAIRKDYAQLRFYLKKKGDKKIDEIDSNVDSAIGAGTKKFKWKMIKPSSAFEDENPDLINPTSLTTGTTTRKAQAL